jgi:hypothetical protein
MFKIHLHSKKKIFVEHSDYADVNQVEMPDAFLLTGNVRKMTDSSDFVIKPTIFKRKLH